MTATGMASCVMADSTNTMVAKSTSGIGAGSGSRATSHTHTWQRAASNRSCLRMHSIAFAEKSTA